MMNSLLLTSLFLMVPLLTAAVPTVKKVSRPDGVRLAYDVRGSGDSTLVFIHGWASERGAWREQADYFAARHQVVTLDLGAHGASTAGKRKAWTLEALAGDVVAVVEAVKAKHVVLVGHSMGGPVALLAAPRLPNVRAVILVDSVHDADKKITEQEATGFIQAFQQNFRGTMDKMVRSMFPADSKLPDEIVAKAAANNPAIVTALIADYPRLDLPGMLRAVRVPIRAINAAARKPTDPATNLAANRKYADFDATLLYDAGHFLMLEKPGEFNALLREWLSVLL